MPSFANPSNKILLVDDEPFILAAIAQVLRDAGHTVHTCDEWAGVAKKVRDVEPDLILLDYNMPTLKGDDLCSILKRNVISPGMKIVLFSSEPEDFLVEVVGKCGADGYIKKDVASATLLEQIERVL
jgi:DNA-binding NarL/FixJ family response regulator